MKRKLTPQHREHISEGLYAYYAKTNPDLESRAPGAKRSTVLLTVGGKPWNRRTRDQLPREGVAPQYTGEISQKKGAVNGVIHYLSGHDAR